MRARREDERIEVEAHHATHPRVATLTGAFSGAAARRPHTLTALAVLAATVAALAQGGALPSPADVVDVPSVADPVPPEPEKPKRGGGKFPGGYCGLAVMWSGDHTFVQWLWKEYPETYGACVALIGDPPGAAPADQVGAWCIKKLCGISSRKELDTKDTARATFEKLIREPYMAFRKERGLE